MNYMKVRVSVRVFCGSLTTACRGSRCVYCCHRGVFVQNGKNIRKNKELVGALKKNIENRSIVGTFALRTFSLSGTVGVLLVRDQKGSVVCKDRCFVDKNRRQEASGVRAGDGWCRRRCQSWCKRSATVSVFDGGRVVGSCQ